MIFSFFHPYGLILGIAAMITILIIEKQSRFFSIDPAWIEKLLFPVLIGALIGARMYHLITDWQLYTGATFFDLIAVWRGGLGFFGGFIGALIGAVIGLYFWLPNKKNDSMITRFFLYSDLLVFGLPVGQAIGRLGNFVNKELYGLPTSLPWGIEIQGVRYHPLFLYEMILDGFLFVCLFVLSRRKSLVLGKGQYFSLYVFGYSLIRFWLEFLRFETARPRGVFAIFSIAQWVCLSFLFLSTALFWIRRHAPIKNWDWTLE